MNKTKGLKTPAKKSNAKNEQDENQKDNKPPVTETSSTCTGTATATNYASGRSKCHVGYLPHVRVD